MTATRVVALVALVALVACGGGTSAPIPAPPPPPSPESLAAYLETVVASSRELRVAELQRWKLDRAAWDRIVVEPFRDAYPAYDARFARAIERFADALHPGTIATRRHFSGDPRGTTSQTVLRWTLPTMYPSAVAELDGQPIDLVFVHDGTGWRTLAGLEVAITDAADALESAAEGPRGVSIETGSSCSAHLRQVANKDCADVGYLIASTAIRSDRPGFTRACSLAASRCGMRSP